MVDQFLQRSTFDLDQEAWDRLAYFAFRPQLFHDSLADVRPTQQVIPGSKVTFTKFGELAEATTPIQETEDVDAVTFTDSKVSVFLNEYGNVVKDTRFLHATSYIPLNPVIANVLGWNAGISMDSVARDVLVTGTNVKYAGNATSRATVDNTDLYSAAIARREAAALEKASVPDYAGFYVAYMHPDVSVDFREETGAAAWREPHVYGGHLPGGLANGEIGAFERIRYVVAPRAKVFAGAGADIDPGAGVVNADVYATLIVGQQHLAKAVPIVAGFGDQPRIVPGPVVDKLRRFVPMGWYHLVGYGIFREESIRRVESGSSLNTV